MCSTADIVEMRGTGDVTSLFVEIGDDSVLVGVGEVFLTAVPLVERLDSEADVVVADAMTEVSAVCSVVRS